MITPQEFRQYLHTEEEWRGQPDSNYKTYKVDDEKQATIASDVFSTYYSWNKWMSNKGQAQNLVKLVVANAYLKTSGGASLNLQTVANPNSLMDTTYQYCYMAKLGENNRNKTVITYSSTGDYFILESTKAEWEGLFPNWKIPEDDNKPIDEWNIEINKYSLWVAAAVNMVSERSS